MVKIFCYRYFALLNIIFLFSSSLVYAIDIRSKTKVEFDARYNTKNSSTTMQSINRQGLNMARVAVTFNSHASWQNQLRFHGQLRGFYDVTYDLRDNYNADIADTYRSELEPGEVYFSLPVGDAIEFTFGRHISNWGYLDFLRVADRLNPLDLTEPGLTDLDNIRLPRLLSELDGLFGAWRITATLLHEFRRDKTVPYGSAYYGFNSRLPPAQNNEVWQSTPGSALSLSYQFLEADLSIYWSRMRRSDGRINLIAGPATVFPTIVFERNNQIGLTTQIQHDNWIMKGEASLTKALKFNNATTKKQSQSGFGLEYQGWNDMLLLLELKKQRLHGFEENMALSPDFAVEKNTQLALFFQWDIIPDQWRFENLNISDESFGDFYRFKLIRSIGNEGSVSAAYITYSNGDHIFAQTLADNDKLALQFSWTF